MTEELNIETKILQHHTGTDYYINPQNVITLSGFYALKQKISLRHPCQAV